MNDALKKLTEKIKSPKILMITGLCGILLIFLSSLFGKEDDTSSRQAQASAGEISAEEYRLQLEESVRGIVSSITGSDKVSVAITLESGLVYSYADVNEGVSSDRTESDSKSTASESKQSYITVKTADGGEQALLVTTEMPEVRGVAIVCEGGDSEAINEKIENAVTAALDITSKRVYIAGGSYDEKR